MPTMTKLTQKTTAGNSPKLTAMRFTNQVPTKSLKKKDGAKTATITPGTTENQFTSLQDKYNNKDSPPTREHWYIQILGGRADGV